MRQGRTGKMGSGLISQYKHSENFIGDGIIGDRSSHKSSKARHKVKIYGEVDPS